MGPNQDLTKTSVFYLWSIFHVIYPMWNSVLFVFICLASFCFEQGVGFVSLNDTLVARVPLPTNPLEERLLFLKHQGSVTRTWGDIFKAV